MKERLIPNAQARAAVLALILASALGGALVGARAIYTGELKSMFLIWNLLLAWIPLATALPLYAIQARSEKRPIATASLFAVWFLFFPNAPYLVTDLIHLRYRAPVPYWFDIIMVAAFVITGLFLGYLSLYLLQEIIRHRAGRAASWGFVAVMLALGSFGIYLGRFLRWNSWDVLLAPGDLLEDAARMLEPATLRQVFAFSATFFAFSLVGYLIVYSFTHLHAWVERTPPAD